MIVKELMSSNVCFIKPDASVYDAAALMKRCDVGFIPVCDSRGCLLGLITDRDIVLRALNPDATCLSTLHVSEIMSSEIVSISPEMNIHDAACVFSEKKRIFFSGSFFCAASLTYLMPLPAT